MLDGTIDGLRVLRGRHRRAADDAARRGRVEGADMLYSSGTTGRPKGVKVAAAAGAAGRAAAPSPGSARCCSAGRREVYLSPAPLYHAAPLRFCHGRAPRSAAPSSSWSTSIPSEFLRLIERHRVTHTQVVPTMFVRMLKLPDEARARFDVSSLQIVVHAAAPCPVPVKEQMIEWWGPVIHEYYAGTEGNGFVYCNSSEEWLAHKGTVGKALIGTVHIVGEDGEEVPPGEAGTIYFEGERGRRSSTTTTPRRRRPRATRRDGAGGRSATSATSTRTATSTSPTARRT